MKMFVTAELVLEFIKEYNLMSMDKNSYNIIWYIENNKIYFKRKLRGLLGAGAGVSSAPSFWFSDFDFEGECFGKFMIIHGERVTHEIIGNPAKSEWRIFMAKKYGEEYINAYSKYMHKVLQERKCILEKDLADFENELLVLQSIIH